MTDDATYVVMTETQKEMVAEVRSQYEQRRKELATIGVDIDTQKGRMACWMPFEMLREAFKGEPPTK
jgi:hypothetical protein